MSGDVLTCAALPGGALEEVLAPYGLALAWCAHGAPIPGTYWGEPEAGLIGDTLHVRADTPVHSALHEAGHFACMDAARRAALHTDAGGTLLEECAVCYLEILLAERLPGVGRARIQRDMDAWGYTFRLGSAAAWFEHDAGDALAFLQRRGLVDAAGRLPGGPGG
ncbi:MAG: hypothetical protein U5K43_00865 [Halofilum sp. (in: g-proteobacteria)]|nr:hypothetical protein [Halofilum sp. (in: g-proteobacteria)]